MSGAISRALPAALSFIAGMVDVTGWLTLGGLFTAHITGNLVVIAADLVEGRAMHIAPVLAVPLFVIVAAGISVGAGFAQRSTRSLINILLWLQAGLLVIAAVAATVIMPPDKPHGFEADIVAMLAVAAMAAQNSLLHLVSKPTPTTSVMTGNVVVAAMSLASAVASRWSDVDARTRWQATWPILVGFLSGCVAGAAAVSALANRGWLIAASVALLCALSLPRLIRISTPEDGALRATAG
jgi:uncharacterized membrane protein YoaK (UPF0700 family)